MKLSVVQENLMKALSQISHVVSSKPSLNILNNVLLSAEASRLKLTATNLELALVYKIGAKVEQEGSTTVPTRLLTELITSLKNDKIQLSTTNHNLTIKTQNFESSLNGISPEEFPVIPEIKKAADVTIDPQELYKALLKTSVAASLEEARPTLAGVYFNITGNSLTMAATDSYRLTEQTIAIKSSKKISVIVPIKTIQELSRVLTNTEGKVSLLITKNEIIFNTNEAQLTSRLIEGSFPDYKQIIPEKTDTKARLNKEEFLKTIKIANLFAQESAHTIKIDTNSQGKLLVTSSAAQVGENTSTIETKISGPDISINLNAHYLIDALSALDEDQISLEFSGKINPCVIKPITNSKPDQNYVHIIMPLRS